MSIKIYLWKIILVLKIRTITASFHLISSLFFLYCRMIELNHYLLLSAILFSLGVIGVLIRRNAIIIFMCIELMLNAVNLSLVGFSSFLGNVNGQIFVFIVLTVAAAEAAIGLAIIIALFRNKDTINIDEINILKW